MKSNKVILDSLRKIQCIQLEEHIYKDKIKDKANSILKSHFNKEDYALIQSINVTMRKSKNIEKDIEKYLQEIADECKESIVKNTKTEVVSELLKIKKENMNEVSKIYELIRYLKLEVIDEKQTISISQFVMSIADYFAREGFLTPKQEKYASKTLLDENKSNIRTSNT